MSKIGATGIANIAPTAAGKPAPVDSIQWSVAPAGVWSITPAADGLSCALAAAAAGDGPVLSVTGIGVGGVTLTETAQLPAVDQPTPPDNRADALNLTVTIN